jgi:hypothetical protein
MDRQQKTFFMTIGLALAILYLFRPKNNLFDDTFAPDNKLSPPKTVSPEVATTSHNGMVIIMAMREALNDNVPQEDVDNLNRIFYNEHGLKVFFGKNGTLVAKNKEGQIVARESDGRI